MSAKKKAGEPDYDTVNSTLFGLYDEIDKLCKKSPAEPLTDRAVQQTNGVIGAVKDLLKGDPFIDNIDLFIPAGENPELRDALMILRLLKQGMQRHHTEFTSSYL